MIKLDVNTDAAIILTEKLERMQRSAFPSAVRNTLNDAAFNTKKLIPVTAANNFTTRQKNLFPKFTAVEKATGFNVENMKSKVGLSGTQNRLLDGLEKQETGGTFTGRKLTPMDHARVSKNIKKKISSRYNFNQMSNASTSKKKVKGSKFFFIKNQNKGTIFENVGNNKIKPIYTLRKTKKVTVKPSPFIKPSVLIISKKMDDYYKKNAEFQFKKLMK